MNSSAIKHYMIKEVIKIMKMTGNEIFPVKTHSAAEMAVASAINDLRRH
jgi:hypothetical protein